MIDIYYELINEESNNKAQCGTLDSEQNAPRKEVKCCLYNNKYVIITPLVSRCSIDCIVKTVLESDWVISVWTTL